MIKSVINKTTAFVLVIILLAHNINTLVVVTDFIINQDFIAKTLCIQKDNQQGCYGKCQLAKQLAQSETGLNGQVPEPISKRLMLDVYFVSSVSVITNNTSTSTFKKNKIYHNTVTYSSNSLPVATPPPDLS